MDFTNFLCSGLLPNLLNLFIGLFLFALGAWAVRHLPEVGEPITAPTKETRTKAAQEITGTTADDAKAAINAAKKLVGEFNENQRARSKRYYRKLLGFSGLAILFACFLLNGLNGFPIEKLRSELRAWGFGLFACVWVVVMGICLAYVLGIHFVAGKDSAALEQSRDGYLDAVKTLIAAAGTAVAVVVAAASKQLMSATDVLPRNVALCLLVLSILLSTCELFWMNLLYDLARVTNREVSSKELKVPLLVLWLAGVTFLMGFAYLAKLAYHFGVGT